MHPFLLAEVHRSYGNGNVNNSRSYGGVLLTRVQVTALGSGMDCDDHVQSKQRELGSYFALHSE
jgi:hypothetical protein